MAYARLGSSGLWIPDRYHTLGVSPGFTSSRIDATGEKVAWCGPFWHPNGPGNYTIVRAGFCFGSVTKAGGSGLTFSLQNVSAAAGQPMQPDETQDQTAAIANGDAAFASNTWYRTGALSANRTLAFGELISGVLEFDGSGRLGADLVDVRNLTANIADNLNGVALKTASWASVAVVPNFVLECDDGSFGTLGYALPASNISAFSFDSADTPDEYANLFTVPVAVKVDGVSGFAASNNAAADFDLVLYRDTTVLATITVDATQLVGVDNRPLTAQFSSEIELTTGNNYYLSIKPTTTTNNMVRAYYRDVDDTDHRGLGGFTNASLVSRTDAGSWGSAVTTRQLLLALRVAAINDGTGGSGGGYVIGG